jgi:hypothetical protein
MADDVLASAVHRQPAPDYNEENTRMSKDVDENKEDIVMEEEITGNKDSINIHPYANTSTTIAVGTTTTTNNNTNITNNISLSNQLDCPSTPFTSNTTTTKETSSPVGYLLRTPTKSPSKDQSVYDYQQPNTVNRVASFRKKSLTRKETTLPTDTPSTPVPPITPFILGQPQTIHMSSLQKALPTTDIASTTPNVPEVTENEQIDNMSQSSMDTTDVSTSLKPKSIFNPYDKRHRIKPTTNITATVTDEATNTETVRRDSQHKLSDVNTTSYTTPHDSIPLIPLTYHTSTKIDTSTLAKPSDQKSKIDTVQDVQIEELTQEEVDFISNELNKQENQTSWQPVRTKSPARKEKNLRTETQPKKDSTRQKPVQRSSRQ